MSTPTSDCQAPSSETDCRKIAGLVHRSRATVARIVKAAGLARLHSLDAPPPPIVRYEYDRVGGLHLDTKKLARIEGLGHRITGNRRGQKRGVGYDFAHVASTITPALPTSRSSATSAAKLQPPSSAELSRGTRSLESRSSACSPTTERAIARTSSPLPVGTQPFVTFELSLTRPAQTARPSASSRPCCVNGRTATRFAALLSAYNFSVLTCTSTIITACTRHSLTSRPSLGLL